MFLLPLWRIKMNIITLLGVLEIITILHSLGLSTVRGNSSVKNSTDNAVLNGASGSNHRTS